MTKKGLPIDFQSIKAMSDLTNKDYTPVGSHVFGRDPLTGQGGWEPNAPPTEEELLDKESQRELRQAQVDYYKAQTVAKPQETQAKLITARRPVSGPRPPADITPAGRAALMAAMVKKGFKF
jgi:hypothetical protein